MPAKTVKSFRKVNKAILKYFRKYLNLTTACTIPSNFCFNKSSKAAEVFENWNGSNTFFTLKSQIILKSQHQRHRFSDTIPVNLAQVY